MAAREDQAQPLVTHAQQPVLPDVRHHGHHPGLFTDLRELLPAEPGPPQPVDRAVPGRSEQPGHWVVRYGVAPLAQRECTSILQRILGEFEVAEHVDQSCEHPGPVFQVDLLQPRFGVHSPTTVTFAGR